MTKRVLCLGNSHLAAVRDALTRFENLWPSLDVTCVGAHGDALLETTCADGILTPISDQAIDNFQTLGGMGAIDLNAYDAIIVVGCQVACSRASYLYRRARWAALPSVIDCADIMNQPWTLVSEPAFAAMLYETLSKTLGGKFIHHLRQGTNRPIYLANQPRTATGIMDIEQHALTILNDIRRDGDAAAVSIMFERIARQLCNDHDVTLLVQPRNTIQEHVMTRPAFTKGAVRLSRQGRYPQPPQDIIHANASYGATVLDQIAKALGVAELADVEQ